MPAEFGGEAGVVGMEALGFQADLVGFSLGIDKCGIGEEGGTENGWGR